MLIFILVGIGALWYIYTLPSRFTFNPPPLEVTDLSEDYVSCANQKIHYVKHIPTLWYPASNSEDPFTIIFSHGNGWDLSAADDYIYRLSQDLDVNILSYDYPGYGIRTDSCNEHGCYNDIYIVYKWLITEKNIQPDRIILLGHSLGSGPSIDLANKISTEHNGNSSHLGGLILISPFTSIVRTVSNILAWIPYLDMFPNIDKMKDIKVPVYIIHGKQDWLVPYTHSVELAEQCKDYLWNHITINEGDHNNIITTYNDVLITTVKEFLHHIRKSQ